MSIDARKNEFGLLIGNGGKDLPEKVQTPNNHPLNQHLCDSNYVLKTQVCNH